MQYSIRQQITTANWDNGYFKQKGLVKNELLEFRSLISHYTGAKMNEESIIVKFNDTEYVVGAGKDNIEADKTENLHNKIFTLTGLGMKASFEETFNLVLALPMSHFKNKDFRENFKNYMIGDKANKITINGHKKIIGINDVTIFMQGAAALYSDPEKFKNKLVALIDIGGLTINACLFENLNPMLDTMTTINLGTLILDNRIKSALNDKFFMNIQDYEIPYLMNNKKYQDIIKQVIDEYFQDVKRELRAKNWNLETLEIYGVGGGMLRLKDYIYSHFSNLTVPNDPQYENVKGLQAIGEMIYGI